MPEKLTSVEIVPEIDFEKMISSFELQDWLEGSGVYDDGEFSPEESWREWESGRRKVADLIEDDGPILDFGCANGLLLRSLQMWSNRKLEPWGFDVSEKAIQAAKRLLPQDSEHFFLIQNQKEKERFERIRPQERFTTSYWNVWDNWEPGDRVTEEDVFVWLQKNTKGTIILGFYDLEKAGIGKIERFNKFYSVGLEPITNGDRDEVFAVLHV